MVEDVINLTLERVRRDGILIKDMPSLLNRYLPEDEQIAEGRSGAVQVSRWLAFDKEYGVTPRGNVVLALQQFANNI